MKILQTAFFPFPLPLPSVFCYFPSPLPKESPPPFKLVTMAHRDSRAKKIHTLLVAAIVHSDARRYGEAIALFLQAAKLHEAGGTCNTIAYVRLLMSVAQTYMGTYDFEPAVKHALQALEIIRAMDQRDVDVVNQYATAEIILMLVYFGSGRVADGILVRSAEGACFDVPGNEDAAIKILLDRSAYYLDDGELSTRLALLRRAEALCIDIMRSEKPSRNATQETLADIHNDLGCCHYEARDFAQALAAFQLALPVKASLFGKQSIQMARVCTNIGNCYRSLRENVKALQSYEQSLSIQEKKWASGDHRPRRAATKFGLTLLRGSKAARQGAAVSFRVAGYIS